MHFDVLTLFPSSFDSFLSQSIIGKAIESKKISVTCHDIRDFTTDKHNRVDDVPFGGGGGMLMTPQPLWDAITHVKKLKNDNARVIFMTPQGKKLNQELVEVLSAELRQEKRIILLCGHYEGIDARIREALVDEEVSIGDFVLTGGELPAQIVIESLARFVPGVLGKAKSANEDSFSREFEGKTEYPHYTRPSEFKGMKVPEILLSGHHAEIEKWRQAMLGYRNPNVKREKSKIKSKN